MVVDTVSRGQACIDFLRSQNVGRASFMVLEKLPSDRIHERIQTPESVPRLYDLIKPKDPKLLPAFHKAVGNTLVADDLEQANRIAFGGSKGWYDVKWWEPCRARGNELKAGSGCGPEVLRQYEQESDAAARELEGATGTLKTLKGEGERLALSGPQLNMDIEKLTMAVNNGRKQLPSDSMNKVMA